MVVNGIHTGVPAGVVASGDPQLAAAIDYVRARRDAENQAMEHLSASLRVDQLHTGHHVATGNELVDLVAGDLHDAIGDLA
mgnify:FL=1